MSLNVISLFPLPDRSRDWNKQELAEFYRVAASLVRGGVSVETDRGRSDEGDPWFVFSQVDTGDVIIHFARFDGDYIVASPALGKCVRGRDFRALIESLIESHPLVISTPVGGNRLFIHPAALLVVLVTTCFFKLYPSSAAAEQADHVPVPSANALVAAGGPGDATMVLDERAAATVLAVIAVAVAWGQSDNSDLGFLAAAPILDVEFSAHVEFAAQGAPTDVSGAFQASALYEGDNGAGASSAAPIALPTSGNSLQSLGGAGSGPSLTDHSLTIRDFPTGGSSPAPSDEGASVSGQSVAISLSDHALWLPVLSAAATTSAPAAAADATIASSEVSVAVGASFRGHVMTDLSGSEQKFILEIAAQTVSPNDLTTADFQGAETSHVNSTIDAKTTDATPTTGSSGAASSSSHPADVSTVSSAATPAIDASSTASGSAAPTVTTSTHVVDGTLGVDALPNAEAAIQQFIGVHPDFQIINYQNEVIIYDPHLTPANLPTASEETFTFHDGSSVVLIGVQSLGAQTTHVLV